VSFELVNIDVVLPFQGRGIGTILVRAVEERARAEGKEAVTAGTSRSDRRRPRYDIVRQTVPSKLGPATRAGVSP